MLRTLSRLVLAAATLVLLTAVQTGPAHADDAAGCRIAPGSTFTFSPFCRDDKPASTYTVAFHAPAGTTGAWSVTGDWDSVWVGCGATDDYCTVTTDGGYEHFVYGSKGGLFVGRAYLRQYCGGQIC